MYSRDTLGSVGGYKAYSINEKDRRRMIPGKDDIPASSDFTKKINIKEKEILKSEVQNRFNAKVQVLRRCNGMLSMEENYFQINLNYILILKKMKVLLRAILV